MRQVRDLPCGDTRIYLEVEVRRLQCRSCAGVKREELAFLADNPLYTKRFAWYVGRRCSQSSIKDVAKELKLHWETVKTLEVQYMRAQLARVGTPGPKAIGIDEISIRKGHTYRIVVSDLIRRRPIWFGGKDRKEKSMALFYDWLGEKKAKGIRLAVMDMWRPFYNVTKARAPQAAILYDKFHILSHLSDALDEVRKSEYSRLSGKARSYIKGQKYTLLSNRENLSLKGRQALKMVLTANKRLHTAYLLRESFGQLWDYHRARLPLTTTLEDGMTDDPDELRYEQAISRKDPEIAIAAIEEIEVHLRYGIPSIKLLAWIIIVLLSLILWRLW